MQVMFIVKAQLKFPISITHAHNRLKTSCFWVEGAVDTSVTLVSSQNICFFLASSSLYTTSLSIYFFLYSLLHGGARTNKTAVTRTTRVSSLLPDVDDQQWSQKYFNINLYVYKVVSLLFWTFNNSQDKSQGKKILSQDWLWKWLEGK